MMRTYPSTDNHFEALASLPRDEELNHIVRQLPGVLADSVDQYDLLRAIRQIDDYCAALSAIRTGHAQNLCRRKANRLVAGIED